VNRKEKIGDYRAEVTIHDSRNTIHHIRAIEENRPRHLLTKFRVVDMVKVPIKEEEKEKREWRM